MANEILSYTVKVDTGDVSKAQKQIEQFKKSLSAKDEKSAIKGWAQYEKASQKAESLRESGNMKKYSSSVRRMQRIRAKYNKKFGAGWGESYDNAESMENLTKSTKKGESALSKFGKKMKEIAAGAFIWNVISKAVQSIANSFKEGLTNLYNFEKAAGGGALTKAMDTISSKFKALKNAIGSVVANFIVAVEPFLTSAIDMLIQLFNKISAVIAKLFGQSSYMEASADIMDSWKDNNEETKKLISGLDNLNILEKESSALEAENGKKYFNEVKFADGNDPLQELKDLWNKITATISNWWTNAAWPAIKAFWNDTAWPAIEPIFIKVGQLIAAGFDSAFGSVWSKLCYWTSSLMDDIGVFFHNLLHPLDKIEHTSYWATANEFYRQAYGSYTPEYQAMKDSLNSAYSSTVGSGSNGMPTKEKVQNYMNGLFGTAEQKKQAVLSYWGISAEQFKAWFGYANGGVITKPTLGLVGEYSNAAANPEIISPKSLMKETMQEANGDIVTALIQCTRQLIQTVNDKDTSVTIGDEAIGAAAARANNAYYKMSGTPRYL